ncbi:fam-a protein [Plasmodium vinckei]|uniref:Fam-a protein n=1 Tax=Plasmodium vinckei TaxID=5860 RepID=A0A6V7SE26_PLAVN|nr:fam-a protein [Plasmodium vinckei]
MNNGYVKVFFFVLILFVYVNDKVLTTEHEADNTASSKTTISKITPSETASFGTASSETAVPKMSQPMFIVLTNPPSPHIASIPVIFELDSVYKKSKRLLCPDIAEIKKAKEVMDEAVTLLQYYATTEDGYKYHCTSPQGIKIYCRKDRHRPSIGKCQFQISNPNKYYDIIDILWDPNGPQNFDPSFVSGKVVRSYNRNLLMVLKHYRNVALSSTRYFYALVKKSQISEDTTIIVMASGNINDHNPFNKKIFKNEILESINSFNTDIDLDDVKNMHLKKAFVNLSGYLIRKKNDHVDVTFVNSMDFNVSFSLKSFVKNPNIEAMQNILSLQSYFDNQ